MIKAVLFDLDGTLCNSIPDIVQAGNLSLAAMGFPPYTEAEYKRFVGNGVKTLIARMLARHPHTQEDERKLLEIYTARYADHALDTTAPYDGIRPLLEGLKSHGILTAVVSNKPMPATRVVIGKLFLPDDFAYTYGQTAPYAPKPDPACVFHVLEQLGVKAEDCMYVGDSDVDMQTAKNSGLFAVGAVWGFRTAEELADNGADLLCRHPLELLRYIKED